MLEFRRLDVSDRDWVCDLLSRSDYMGAEYSFANNLAWQRLSDSLVTRYGDLYTVLMPDEDSYTYTFPAGSGDRVELIDLLREYSSAHGRRCSVFGVTEEQLPLFESHYAGEYTVRYLSDSSDYVYLASDLAELKGRKYHGKRNHLKKVDAYAWRFDELQESDFDECILLSAESYVRKGGYTDHSARVEQYAIDTFFRYYRELHLVGGAVRIDGRLVAYSVGERLNSNTVVVHLEKADASYEGLYALVNQQFVRRFCSSPDVLYVNREEDLGIEGLRKAKRSYHPVFQVEKHLVEFTQYR